VTAYNPARDILRMLAEIKRRVVAGELQGVAVVAIPHAGFDTVVAAAGYADGGDDEWCDALEELRERVVSGEVSEPPDGDDDPDERAN
jgi:hypothetical protein